MEDIFQIVVFAVIIVIGIAKQFIGKVGNAEETPSPKDILSDMFPEIAEEEQPVLQKAPVQRSKPARKVRLQQTVGNASPEAAPTAPTPSAESKKSVRSTTVRLNTREEARRAFIHAEIFNRKY